MGLPTLCPPLYLVANPETDSILLAIAEDSSAAQFESLVRTYERWAETIAPAASSGGA